LSISSKIGCAAQTLNEWVKNAEVDSGNGVGVPSEMAEKTKTLEQENRELGHANEILRKASGYFAQAGHGVEPICKVLPIAPSTYYDHPREAADPDPTGPSRTTCYRSRPSRVVREPPERSVGIK